MYGGELLSLGRYQPAFVTSVVQDLCSVDGKHHDHILASRSHRVTLAGESHRDFCKLPSSLRRYPSNGEGLMERDSKLGKLLCIRRKNIALLARFKIFGN